MKIKTGYIDLKAASDKVFQYYLGHLYPNGFVILGKNISNPFLSKPQETPSFNIMQARDKSLIFYDFATGDKGNCITLVARLKGVSRLEAIKIIVSLVTK